MQDSTKVLVTGGAGFIGSHVVEQLVNEGYTVRILDNLYTGKLGNIQNAVKSGKVEFVNGDIRDSSLVEKSLDGVNKVVHLAALVSVPFSVKNPAFTFDVNLLGTLNLLRASVKYKAQRLIFISSCSVCGDPESLPVTEQTKTNPISPYAESKLIAERYCLGFSERHLLDSVILRFFNVYGPRQGLNDYSGVITLFINQAKKNLPLTIYGDGTQTRDFVNVADIAQAVISALKSDNVAGEIFNIGSGEVTSINQLAKTIIELTGTKSQINYKPPRIGDIKDSYADISKAKKILNYIPTVSLRTGLQTMIEQRR
jgi:UDP-glucose 4-epimerase